MMRDTEASQTLISTKLLQQFGERNVEETASGIKTFDHQKRQYLGAFFF